MSARGPAGRGAPAHPILLRATRLQRLHGRRPPRPRILDPRRSPLPLAATSAGTDPPLHLPSTQRRDIAGIGGDGHVGSSPSFGRGGGLPCLACRVGRRCREIRRRQGRNEQHDPVAGYTFGHDENERRTIFINKFGQHRPGLARTGSASSHRRWQLLRYCAALDVSSQDPRNRRAVHWQRRRLVDASAVGS